MLNWTAVINEFIALCWFRECPVPH